MEGEIASLDPSGRLLTLEQELRAKEEYLQATLEEMETTNEELKSTNEEMQSVNEELQSTNEELETSKEEMQSLNEELSTVNAELQTKVSDLSRANNDMNNLLAGTGVGTLFVDPQLCISRFTPATTQVINLIPTDIGRPVAHIVSNLVGYDNLVEDVRWVLESLIPRESEVQTKSGSWYLMRIRPYRTLENVIEGVVITFVDITERKRAEDSLRESERKFATAFRASPDALVICRQEDGTIIEVNDSWEQVFGYAREEAVGRLAIARLFSDPKDLQCINAQLEAGPPVRAYEARCRIKSGSDLRVRVSMERLETAGQACLLTFIHPITQG